MSPQEAFIPDLDWIAVTRSVDESWLGPGPMLVNLRAWIERLARSGHKNLVAATYAAAIVAHQHWNTWLAGDPIIARQALLDSQPPTEQLEAVARWLDSPTSEHKALALATIDLTKQLHWFHEEYSDVWFEEPGMWAIESSEYCVLTLAGDPYSGLSVEEHATISVCCALNSFRKSVDDDIRDSLRIVVDAIRRQFQGE